MIKYILTISLFLVFLGCRTFEATDFYNESELTARAEATQDYITQVKSKVLSMPLDEKAALFEKRILDRFHPIYKLVERQYSSKKANYVRTDVTCHFLAALACKYGVLKQEKDKRLIEQIIDTFLAADTANGFDGFLPYKVRIVGDKLEVVSNETHENVYVQLFFAYVTIMKYVDDIQIKNKIQRHSELILNHFANHNFVLVDDLGNTVDYSDLSPTSFTILHNRQLSLLSLLDVGLFMAENKQLLEKLQQTREQIIAMGYESSVLDLHTKLFNLEFPTHSSSWLNFLKIYNGWQASGQSIYTRAYQELYREYEDEKNPFFTLIGQSLLSQPSPRLLGEVKALLKTFPLDVTNREMINSGDPKLKILSGNYVKLKRHFESELPLPIYRRPLNNYLWKRNQMIVDENFKSTGQVTFSGIDFLQAYWLMRVLEIKN